MIDIIKKDFLNGLKTLKFWAQTLSDRLKVEINVLQTISEINKLNEKKDELLKQLGDEVYKLWGISSDLSDNEKIFSIIRQIREIEEVIDIKKKRLSELEDISAWKH